MNDRPDERQPAVPSGLCGFCRHAREVRTPSGGRFVRCDRARMDDAFAKYPRLPVTACRGYEVRTVE